MNRENPMKMLRTVVLATIVALTLPAATHLSDVQKASAAEPTAADMEILKQKIKADKKLVVAENMQLTDAEAKSFWPIYDEYQKNLSAINERTVKMIREYADAWNKGDVPDATAKKLRDEAIAIDEAEAKLKRDFAPRLDKAVGPVKAARYQQIENKIRAIIMFELATKIPLVQ
jgi:hypothetical protein